MPEALLLECTGCVPPTRDRWAETFCLSSKGGELSWTDKRVCEIEGVRDRLRIHWQGTQSDGMFCLLCST